VYDSPSVDKIHCPPVFELTADGIPRVTNKGKYYKNVRKEWASLVSTPHTARFQDALAFTRSLGDLHLSTYGVTNLPEVRKIILDKIYDAMDAHAAATAATVAQAPPMLCVVLATDGVWDNWEHADVSRFVLDATCIKAVSDGPDGAQKVALSFMQRNAHYSKKNFGRSADNATGIVMYLTRR
jgi:serine/threonine protein phosphatase PrpC